MLSYRHAFHAGNHADVLKHAVLVSILDYLKQKDKPFWYVDTHAGAGVYDLAATEAKKNAEFAAGIGRLWQPSNRQSAPSILDAYFEAIAALNPDGVLRLYPGSPAFAAQRLREQDRLRLFDLHPRDVDILCAHFAGDRRVLVSASDGFTGLKALLPPPPRRAVVLIDPPYEIKDDYQKVEAALADGQKRFASGTYIVWYPLLPRAEAQELPERLIALGLSALRVELQVDKPAEEFGLYGSGLFIVNPPWTLFAQLEELLPWLQERLALSDSAAVRLEKLGAH
jgi:23S rRNA (adenine2030-N6)-methyltransferase